MEAKKVLKKSQNIAKSFTTVGSWKSRRVDTALMQVIAMKKDL